MASAAAHPDGTSRIKPDISAPTGVVTSNGTSSGATSPFSGTSAAAPHVGGMAALVKERFGFVDPQDVQDWLERHADRNGSVDFKNNDIGAGAARHCLVNNPSADDGGDAWSTFGTPVVAGGPNPHFVIDDENDHFRQDLDLSYMTADIAGGGFEFTFIADMYAQNVGVQEGYPYLYGYLFGQPGEPNRINTYLTTGRVQAASWASGEATFPVPEETNKFRIFLNRSSYAGANDANTAYFDNVCAFFNK